jgi:hypothetical protein
MFFVPGLALAIALTPTAARFPCSGPDSLPSASLFSDAIRAETGLVGWSEVSGEPVTSPEISPPADTLPNHAGSRPSAVAGPVLSATFPRVALELPQADTAPGGRPRATQYSQGYYTRLAIHRYASYATLPLFVTEFIIGEKLYRNDTTASDGLRGAHSAVALAIGGLFAINTVTGGWNFWQSRHDPEGRTRRTIHSLLMFVSDAGFLATAATAPERERERGGVVIRPPGDKNLHRNLAIASFSTALVGYAMMLIWK